MGAGSDRGLWAVMLVLLLAVLVPTACVLWFMIAAMRNERYAVREKLSQAYQVSLGEAQKAIDRYWDGRADLLNALPGEGPGETFKRLTASGLVDGCVIFDDEGNLVYPNAAAAPRRPATSPHSDEAGWERARLLEFERGEAGEAAEIYSLLAEHASHPSEAARALLAAARCLGKAGQKDSAVELITTQLEDRKYTGVLDARGRNVLADARLLALELIGDPSDPRSASLGRRLADQINDYADLSIPSAQRQFVMIRLREILPNLPPFPSLAAEQTTMEWLDTLPHWDGKRVPVTSLITGATGPPTIDSFRSTLLSSDMRVQAIYRGRRVVADLERMLNGRAERDLITLRVHNSLLPPPREPFLEAGASDRHMDGWRIYLYLKGDDPFAAAAKRQNTGYLWTGALVILIAGLLSVTAAAYVRRQMKLTRLKNDLIATVSHELKTPLASMRVLVDTLREGRCKDEGQAQEYFELIARENLRLSRLIDNFLTFSRMERNKRTFEFVQLRPGEIVRGAVDSARERFARPGCRLDVDTSDDLPPVIGDRDALITVLLNLLDNAYKYSGDSKLVTVRACEADGDVCFEVTDNGIGMSRRAARKVFARFYRVDQSLSRGTEGCGLGLSIVRFIVDAHGGSVRVTTRPDEGSTFTVRLPAHRPSPARSQKGGSPRP